MVTKRELELELELAARTTPGGLDVRLALPAGLGLLLLIVGGIPEVSTAAGSPFSPLWLVPVGLAIGAAGWRATEWLWPDDTYGPAPQEEGHYLAGCVGFASAVYLPCAGYLGTLHVLWPLGIGVLVFAVLLAGICLGAPRHALQVVDTVAEAHRHEVDALWRAIFDESDLRAVEITERVEWPSGAGFTLRCEPHEEAARRATFAEFAGKLGVLITNADYRLRRSLGIRITEDCLAAEPGTGGSEFLLHVRTRNVFAESRPYVARTLPGDIADGIDDVGHAQDGEQVDLAGGNVHTKVVGTTGSGKSNLTNVMIGRTTDKANALAWIAATDKLIPLVFPWLLPWIEGTTDRPVIDYIAGQSRVSVLVMLANALCLADERTKRLTRKSKREATPWEPAVIVYMDEASHAVEDDNQVIMCHDGLERNISGLLYALSRAGRATNVCVKVLTQIGLMGGMGDHGSEFARNLRERICLLTATESDGRSTCPGMPLTVDTTRLRDYAAYHQRSHEDSRAIPWKAYELDGDEMIVPVAVQNTAWKPQIEGGSSLWSEPGYANRWSAAEQPDLVTACREEGLDYPAVAPGLVPDEAPRVRTDADAARAAVDREAAAAGATAAPEPAPAEPAPAAEGEQPAAPDAVEAELREIIEKTSGPTVDTDRTRQGRAVSKRFEIPDEATIFGTLGEIIGRIGQDPRPGEDGEDGEDEAQQNLAPAVPSPLAEVVGWLDGSAYALDQVRTGTLAEALGIDPLVLGRDLGALMREAGFTSRNVRRDVDPQQRKGWNVPELRAAAARSVRR